MGSSAFHKQVITSHSFNGSRKQGRVWYKAVQFPLLKSPQVDPQSLSESYMQLFVTQALYRFEWIHVRVSFYLTNDNNQAKDKFMPCIDIL